MSERVRWGILSTGGIAAQFTTDLLATGHVVAAVGSRSAASAAEFAESFGIGRAHGSYAELVSDPQVDAIYVATPHPFHAENARLALEHGKHVLVEKPFTLNAAEAEGLVALATERGLVLLEAMWTRFLPHMARLRELLADGAIGELRVLHADHVQNLPQDPNHRLQSPELGGGALLDLGVYPVSFAHDLFGTPDTVHAISTPTPTGVDRSTVIVLGWQGGKQALIHTALDMTLPNRAVLIGTEGRIELDPTWYNATTFRVYDADGTLVETVDGSVESRGMQYEAIELERLVTEGLAAGDILPPDETVAVMRTLDAVREQIGLVYPGGR
jgi:predicted dehydrogenase